MERDRLVGLLAVDSVGPLAAVVGLDGEAVLALALAVQRLLGPDQALPGGAVQNHRLKLDRAGARGAVMNPEATDFALRKKRRVRRLKS